jgi:sensor histidine kinase YesM
MPIDGTFNDLIVFLCLALVVNVHTSILYPKFSNKNKWRYVIILIGSIMLCGIFELLFFFFFFGTIFSVFVNIKQLHFVAFIYTFIRDFAVCIFFLWIESFHRLLSLYREKEKMHQEEMALLIERQTFEKEFSRKKLLPHHFFNLLEHFYAKALNNNNDHELLNKGKFILYYFLVDAEKELIELEKELVFYKYYVELENFRYKNSIAAKVNVIGQIEDCFIIPLLFEPVIGNALKYTNHDGSGWVDIEFDASFLPVLNFRCKNNYVPGTSNIVSSESGLKLLKQRLELCYKNNFSIKVEQTDDVYEVLISVKIE